IYHTPAIAPRAIMKPYVYTAVPPISNNTGCISSYRYIIIPCMKCDRSHWRNHRRQASTRQEGKECLQVSPRLPVSHHSASHLQTLQYLQAYCLSFVPERYRIQFFSIGSTIRVWRQRVVLSSLRETYSLC